MSLFYGSATGFFVGLTALGVSTGLLKVIQKVIVRDRKASQAERDAEAEQIVHEISAGGNWRKYFLYLRPFETTGQMNVIVSQLTGGYGEKKAMDFETLLRKALEPWGPFIGLGTPGEHLGAGRAPVEDSRWQARVRRLIKNADTVFIIPGGTAGTLWEFRHLFKSDYLRRTVVVMPPKALDLDIGTLWSEAQSALTPTGVKLPEYSARGAFILLSNDGRPERTSRMPKSLNESELRDALRELIR
jgi:hypothetical protein